MKVVIDTNVLISALLFGGTPGKLVPLWKNGRIKPQASKKIFEEYIKVLAYPKFALSESEISYLLQVEILPYFDIVAPGSGSLLVKDDPSDDKFIHCAETGKAKFIITGDHHLLRLESYAKIEHLAPSDFLARF